MRQAPAILMLILIMVSLLMVLPPTVSADATDTHFLVMDDAGCAPAITIIDADCWSHTSGGAGGAGVPVDGNRAVLDSASGAGTGELDSSITVDEWSMVGFTGTINLSCCPTLTVNGPSGPGFVLGGTFILAGQITAIGVNVNMGTGTFSAPTGDGSQSMVRMERSTAGVSTLTTSATTVFEEMQFVGNFAITTDSFLVAGSDLRLSDVDVFVTTLEIAAPNNLVLRATTFAASARFEFPGEDGLIMDGQPLIRGNMRIDYTPTSTPSDLTITEWLRTEYTPVALEFLMTSADPAATIGLEFNAGGMYEFFRLLRDSALIATDNTGSDGIATFSVAGGWGTNQRISILGPGAAVGGGLPPPTLPPTPFLSTLPGAPTCSGTTLVVTDTRGEAANAVLWVWSWGDGTSTTTSESTVTHTYATTGTYQIAVRVQDTSGRIDTYRGFVTVTPQGCAILATAQLIGPYIVALLILILVAIIVQIIFDRTRYTRLLGAITVGLAILILVFIIFGWPVELPGHIKFS